jgi:hypothetical protein
MTTIALRDMHAGTRPVDDATPVVFTSDVVHPVTGHQMPCVQLGLAFGRVIVHPATGDHLGDWCVSHGPSGYAFLFTENAEHAIDAARQLHALEDDTWSFTVGMPAEFKARVYPLAQALDKQYRHDVAHMPTPGGAQ